ncbi:MAG: hypothetical protein KatS3mg115_1556 [Candidatus Poribacteria bacterium]|nr:MAG: hypothetical protein KatS3mg115_1556 [Candidatus Poribacteria bacterium]
MDRNQKRPSRVETTFAWLELDHQPLWVAWSRLCAAVPEALDWAAERLHRADRALERGDPTAAADEVAALEAIWPEPPGGSTAERLLATAELFQRAGHPTLSLRARRLAQRWGEDEPLREQAAKDGSMAIALGD